MKIDYHTHNWGPLLFRTKITVEDLKKVKALSKKDKKEDATKTLAGVINHEYLIDKKNLSNTAAADLLLQYGATKSDPPPSTAVRSNKKLAEQRP